MPNHSPPTAILMMNMGGPAALADVAPFLRALFADRELISLPLPSILGPLIARMRAPKVRRRYAQIGGGSPILRWTTLQGQGMVERLDRLCPRTAPHRFYVAFRYAPPFALDALAQMKADGARRAVAFTQYPQYSDTTTGSNLSDLWRSLARAGLEDEFEWSVIDRWPTQPGFISALAETVRQGLGQFPAGERDEALLLFSAHSLPLKVVERGDPYPQEVAASVEAVLRALDLPNEHRLSYQSAVGPVKWLGPKTDAVLRELGRQGRRGVLVVPIAFVSDHIETLHEIDIEFRELAERSGIARFARAPALNDSPLFLDALAEIAAGGLGGGGK